MNPDLLNDTIDEGDYGEFRERLEKKFCAEVARKKWRRRATWLAAAAAVALIAFLNWSKQPQIVTQVVVPPRDAVPTIKTSNIKFDDLLVSAKEPVPIIRTHAFTTQIITTDHSKQFPSISDDELLRFFPKHPTGLMAAHGEKRFIFIDAADAKRFMSSN